MPYDWDTISEQSSPEEAYYRLLGEMLHRNATARDLDRLRGFLRDTELGDDVWLSLGEGLFQTTLGSSVGYRIWIAWSRNVLGERFDEANQLEAWQRFKEESSDGILPTRAPDPLEFMPEVETDDTDRTLRTPDDDEPRPHHIAQDPLSAISLIPSGPHTIRIFDEVYENVDEFAVLRLLQSGVLLELELLFGMRWMSVREHPGFTSLIRRMREEAMAELATTERSRAEVTQPGTQ